MTLDFNRGGHLFACLLCLMFWIAVGFLAGRYYYKRA